MTYLYFIIFCDPVIIMDDNVSFFISISWQNYYFIIIL